MIRYDVQAVQKMAGHAGHVMRRDEVPKQYGIRRRMCFCSAKVKGQSLVIFMGQHNKQEAADPGGRREGRLISRGALDPLIFLFL